MTLTLYGRSLSTLPRMVDWQSDRLGSAHRRENPLVMARMRSGFAVIGDTQHLPGYSVLLCEDRSADHLTDLPWTARAAFLLDLSLIGEAIAVVCSDEGLRRVNYEVLGNSFDQLHGHVHARYEWEPEDRIGGPVWRYPKELRNSDEYAYNDARHGELRARITDELLRVMDAAYAVIPSG
jgi:diadenosine tetraphosphate (Ap4A) HIT family hydrolase